MRDKVGKTMRRRRRCLRMAEQRAVEKEKVSFMTCPNRGAILI